MADAEWGESRRRGDDMYSRLTTLSVQREYIEQGIEIFEKSVVPAARRQVGYRGMLLLSDKQSGKIVSISFWDRKKSALANERNQYYQEQLIKFIAMFAAGPVREGFDVDVIDFSEDLGSDQRK